MKLSHKLILGMLVPALVIGLVGMYVLNIGQASMRSGVNDASAAYVSAIMAEIDRTMHSRIVGWQAYSSGQDIRDFLIGANDRMAGHPDPETLIAERDADWRATAAGKTNALMKKSLNNRVSRLLRGLQNRLNQGFGYTLYPEIFITDSFGAIVSQTGLNSDYKHSDQTWWQQAREKGVYIGNVEFDNSSDTYATDVAFRIEDDNGDFLGVMKVVISLIEVQSIIHQRSQDEQLAKRFNFMLFTDERQIIHTNMHESGIMDDGSAYFSGVDIPDDAAVYTSERVEQNSGDQLLSAYAFSQPYGELPALGWILLHEYYAEDIYEPIYRLQRKVFMIALVTALLALVAGSVIAYSISRRVRRLVMVGLRSRVLKSASG